MAKNRPKTQMKNKSTRRTGTSVKKGAAGSGNRSLLWIGIALILVVAVIFIALSLSNQQPQQAALASLPAEISVQEAYDLVQQGVFLLDVRTQGEWDEVHVPEATLIPLDELSGRLDELPQDRQIVVMCRSGNRSQTGRDILLNAGFDSVTSMDGGINDWLASGFPTVP